MKAKEFLIFLLIFQFGKIEEISAQEDQNILLWQDLRNRLQKLEKGRSADTKSIRRLEKENHQLRTDLDNLRYHQEKEADKKSLIRRRRSNVKNHEEFPIEFLDEPFEDVPFLESQEKPEKCNEKKTIDWILGQIKDLDVKEVKQRIHHFGIAISKLQISQQETKEKQKWIVLQAEKMKNEMSSLESEVKSLGILKRTSNAVQIQDEDTQNTVANDDSSGDADSSGWQSVSFLEDNTLSKFSNTKKLRDADATAKDAFSLATQMKSKLDVVEKDLSKIITSFQNVEKSDINESELNSFMHAVQFVQDSLENVTRRLAEDDGVHEMQHSKFQDDVADVSKRLRLLSLQLEKSRHLVQIVKDHQGEHFSAIQQFRHDLNAMEANVLRLGMKLGNFQAEILNITLGLYKENNKDLQQDVQLADLYTRFDRVDGKFPEIHQTMKDMQTSVRSKAERAEVKMIGADVQKLAEKLQMVSDLNSTMNSIEEAVKLLETQLPADCSAARVNSHQIQSSSSSVQLIKPKGSPKAIRALCQFDMISNGSTHFIGWTVIQNRVTGREDFNRTWEQYQFGFGHPKSDFWLGNEYIHMLTRQRDTLLRVDAWDIFGEHYYAEYGSFKVASVEEKFRLDIGQFSGNLTDAMKHHSGMQFSAFDVDADASSSHCARYYASGWWFSNCQKANLNGIFPLGVIWFNRERNDWIQLQKTTMKVTPNFLM